MTQAEEESGYAAWRDNFTDFRLLVDGNELKCHKSFLARSSPVMCRMLSNEYLETNTGQMDIKNFDLETVTSFLEYIYAESISGNTTASLRALGFTGHIFQRDVDKRILTAQLLEMSKMFKVKDLEKECIDYLKDNMTEENAVDVWGAAEKCRSKILLDSVLAFIIPGMEGPRGTVLNQTPGIDRVAGPLGKKLLDSLHTRYESLHVEYSEAASTNEVIWVESQAEKRSLLKELLYEFKCYYHYTNTEHICHTGYFVTVAKDANEILWQFPSMSSLEDPNFDNLATHPDIFGTTAAAIKGKQYMKQSS